MSFTSTDAAQRQNELIRTCIEAELLAAQEAELNDSTHNDSWFLYRGAIPRLKEPLPSAFPNEPVRLAFKNGKLVPRL